MMRLETIGVRSALHAPEHAVQFYEDDEFLAAVVADFLAVGLRLGRPGLVIATPEHRAAIEMALSRRGLDAAGTRFLDARGTLTQFMRNGRPDAERFEASVGTLVAEVTRQAGGRVIHAFGEMVDVLCGDRMPGAAIELERLWNALIERHAINLLCAYRTDSLTNADGGATFDQVCGCHGEIWPTQRLAAAPDEAARLRHVARLEHRVRDAEPASIDGANRLTAVEADAAAYGRFASAASHELRNPVHVLRLQIQAVLRALRIDAVPDVASIRTRLERADAQAVKLARILDVLLAVRHSDN